MPSWLGRVAAATVVLSLALTGCSDESTSSEDSASAVELAPVLVDGSTYGAPPSEAPAAPKDFDLWIVSCGQTSHGCAAGVAGVQEAAEKLGWNATLCDGKLNQGGAYSECIRQGVAADVDAIIADAVDCAAVQQPLREAAAAGIPTINFWGFDCDTGATQTGESLYAASVIPSDAYPTNEAYQQALGAARAEWIIAKSGGKADIIEVRLEGVNIGEALHAGFAEAIEKCDGCDVTEAVVTQKTFPTVRQIVESALLSNPDAKWVAVPLDSLVLLGAAQAVSSSPRRNDLHLIGGEGLHPNLDLIRENQGQNAAVGLPSAWYGYAAVDTLIRHLAGEEPVPSGMGYQVVDADNNLPESGGYEPPLDFKAAYEKAWGL